MASFRAFRVEKTEDRQFPRSIIERDVADLPDGDLLIDVAWSSLNYKDGLSATGHPGVSRNFPHTPGIDAAGTVVESSSSDFSPGDAVIAIGFDLGMNTPGGFGQKIRIPAGWAVPLPNGLDARSSMILGTAGFTAALSVHKLETSGMRPEGGPVLVTGSTGGVGSIAVKLLAHLGYEVHAVTGKASSHDFLRGLGARKILSREDALQGAERPLLKPRWGGAVDTVGGPILFNAMKALRYGASLAACGLVASPEIPATVFPFILRGVKLVGIDSVYASMPVREELWRRLGADLKPAGLLETIAEEITLEGVIGATAKILKGEIRGRTLVRLRD